MPATLTAPELRPRRTPRPTADLLSALFTPLSPVGGAPSDASALALAWQTPDVWAPHHVQVARDEAFTALVADVEAPGDALVLHGVLPEDEATYYWRVGRDDAWSAPAAFRASTDEAVIAHRDQQIAEALAALKASASTRASEEAAAAEANAPWRTGTTSRRDVLVLLYVLFVTFAMTLALVFRIAP